MFHIANILQCLQVISVFTSHENHPNLSSCSREDFLKSCLRLAVSLSRHGLIIYDLQDLASPLA